MSDHVRSRGATEAVQALATMRRAGADTKAKSPRTSRVARREAGRVRNARLFTPPRHVGVAQQAVAAYLSTSGQTAWQPVSNWIRRHTAGDHGEGKSDGHARVGIIS
ncbi:MAG: hypothetical protein JWM85_963 [Acidimicrobiaceae bacterium]|nr:hypothetical protein [Acidimicrobiaceae bacterium]